MKTLQERVVLLESQLAESGGVNEIEGNQGEDDLNMSVLAPFMMDTSFSELGTALNGSEIENVLKNMEM